MDFTDHLMRKATAMVASTFSDVPHAQCDVVRTNEGGDVVLLWDGWAPTLHRASAVVDDYVSPLYGVETDWELVEDRKDRMQRAIAGQDATALVEAIRPHVVAMAHEQRRRARLGRSLGIRQPLPSPLLVGTEYVRIGHITIDEHAADLIGDDLRDRVAGGLRCMVDTATADDGQMIGSDDENDGECNRDYVMLHPLAPVALYHPRIQFSPGLVWHGGVLVITGPQIIPQTAAIELVGRRMGDLIAIDDDLDERIIESVVVRDDETIVEHVVRPVALADALARLD